MLSRTEFSNFIIPLLHPESKQTLTCNNGVTCERFKEYLYGMFQVLELFITTRVIAYLTKITNTDILISIPIYASVFIPGVKFACCYTHQVECRPLFQSLCIAAEFVQTTSPRQSVAVSDVMPIADGKLYRT